MEMHRLHVLVEMSELGKTTSILDNSKGPPGEIHAWRRPDRLVTSHPGVDIIILVGEIDFWCRVERDVGWHREPQDPKGGLVRRRSL